MEQRMIGMKSRKILAFERMKKKMRRLKYFNQLSEKQHTKYLKKRKFKWLVNALYHW